MKEKKNVQRNNAPCHNHQHIEEGGNFVNILARLNGQYKTITSNFLACMCVCECVSKVVVG
jgi:hypothetical protein